MMRAEDHLINFEITMILAHRAPAAYDSVHLYIYTHNTTIGIDILTSKSGICSSSPWSRSTPEASCSSMWVLLWWCRPVRTGLCGGDRGQRRDLNQVIVDPGPTWTHGEPIAFCEVRFGRTWWGWCDSDVVKTDWSGDHSMAWVPGSSFACRGGISMYLTGLKSSF